MCVCFFSSYFLAFVFWSDGSVKGRFFLPRFSEEREEEEQEEEKEEGCLSCNSRRVMVVSRCTDSFDVPVFSDGAGPKAAYPVNFVPQSAPSFPFGYS